MLHPCAFNTSWRRSLLGAASFLFAVQMHAQPPVDAEREGYEVTGHQAAIHLYPESNIITSTDTVTVRLINPKLDHLRLGLIRLYDVREFTINGRPKDVRRERDDIVIEDLPHDTVVQFTVTYTGIFPPRSEYSSFSSDRATLREEEVLPFGPKAEKFIRLSVAVPNDWTVVTAGTQMSAATHDDTTTFVWQMDQPVPFFGWICAGKFRRDVGGDAGVPISTYLYGEDSSSSEKIMSLAQKVLRFYGDRFSPYRFHGLNIVEVDDGIAGRNLLAIALPSFIMVKKLAFTTNDKYNQVDAVLAHEIAHQWWPITVYTESEDAAFLSEGMCEYSSMLYNEAAGKQSSRDSLKVHPLLRALISRIMKGDDLPLQMKADLRSLPTHYLKASFVHNMLRHLIGDSTFSMLYREYARRFTLRKASLDDFRQLAEELSGRKLSLFFDQWVKKKGVPRLKIYNVKSVASGNRWTTRGRVRLVGYEKYTTLVDVGVETPAGLFKQRVALGMDSAGVYHNDVPFEMLTERKPTHALLDPDGDILKIQKLPVRISDLRDPGDGTMVVGTLSNKESLLSLARRDMSEMERGGWSIRIKEDTSITLGDLQQERLILYGKPSENSVVKDLETKFPHRVSNDSLIVNGEAIFDSSLTLIQAIESPYSSLGLIFWVAPLSPRAKPELLPFDASWVVLRGTKEISSGTWEVEDEDLIVGIK